MSETNIEIPVDSIVGSFLADAESRFGESAELTELARVLKSQLLRIADKDSAEDQQTEAQTFECERGHKFTLILHVGEGKRAAGREPKLHNKQTCVVFRCYCIAHSVGTTTVEEL